MEGNGSVPVLQGHRWQKQAAGFFFVWRGGRGRVVKGDVVGMRVKYVAVNASTFVWCALLDPEGLGGGKLLKFASVGWKVKALSC